MSLAIITLNEERNLQRCVESVPFASEVIVLDSGSTDATAAVAEKLGAKFYSEPWQGFTKQKARAVELASHDWILSLDADEALSPELAEEIQFLLSSEEPLADGYEMPRRSFHLGRWIRRGGWYPDIQLRLFHRKRASWRGGAVHERVHAQSVKRLRGDLLHYPFLDLSDQVETNNKYSFLGAEDLRNKRRHFSLFKLITKPWTKFAELYVLKRGFLDGLPGFIIAVGGAYSVFLKWAKLWELERKQGLPGPHPPSQGPTKLA